MTKKKQDGPPPKYLPEQWQIEVEKMQIRAEKNELPEVLIILKSPKHHKKESTVGELVSVDLPNNVRSIIEAQ